MKASGVALVVVTIAVCAGADARGQRADGADSSVVLREYRNVSFDRLRRPADTDWLMIRRTYDGWGFSPLTQITTANVARLQRCGRWTRVPRMDTRRRHL